MGRHPGNGVTARYWAEIIVASIMFLVVTVADFAALGRTSIDAYAPAWALATIVTLALAGWVAQFVVCVVMATTAVDTVIRAGRAVREWLVVGAAFLRIPPRWVGPVPRDWE
jgi:hypothetical protein